MLKKTAVLGAALIALAGCATVQEKMPDWMPGSGAFRVAKGTNGPVIVPLVKSGDTYTVPEGRKLNDAQMQALKAGNLYVNVHSDRYKGGEIRAQLQP